MPNIELPTLLPRRALIFSPRAELADELELLLRLALPDVRLSLYSKYPTSNDLANLFQGGTPYFVFIDAVSDPKIATNLIGEISRSGPRIHVLALLDHNDPDLILKCLRSGAADFLLQPFGEDQLAAAIATISRTLPTIGQEGREPGKIYCVMPARGACGSSTVACNLAFALKKAGKKVLLADLDPLTGTMSFLLKINAQVSFMDVLNREHELDGGLWESIVKTVNGVDVLLAPELMEAGLQDLTDPNAILDYARYRYDAIVTDSANVYGDWNLNQSKLATEVLLVTTNELPALQAAQRALSYLDTNKIGRWKLKLVVNRYHQNVGLSKDMIATALHLDVFETLPSDYVTVQKSLMDGTPIPTATPLGKGLAQLTQRLLGNAPAPKKATSSGFNFFGLFAKAKPQPGA